MLISLIILLAKTPSGDILSKINKKKYALILLVPFFRNIVNSTMETGSLCIIIPVSRPLCACVSKCSPDNGIPSIKACLLKLTNTEIGIELFL